MNTLVPIPTLKLLSPEIQLVLPTPIASWQLPVESAIPTLQPIITFFDPVIVQIKLVAVIILTYYHFTLGKYLNDFAIDNNLKTSKFFRIYNEIPTIILIVVIFVAIFKPL